MKHDKNYRKHENIIVKCHRELYRSFLKIRLKETAWLSQYGLTLSQFVILEALYNLGELSVGEITKATISTPGNITVVIKNLNSKKLIDIYPSHKDKRIKMLNITQKGSELIKVIFPNYMSNLISLYDQVLNTDELETLSTLLEKLEKSQ